MSLLLPRGYSSNAEPKTHNHGDLADLDPEPDLGDSHESMSVGATVSLVINMIILTHSISPMHDSIARETAGGRSGCRYPCQATVGF
jgi:hypothetical protein